MLTWVTHRWSGWPLRFAGGLIGLDDLWVVRLFHMIHWWLRCPRGPVSGQVGPTNSQEVGLTQLT